ncbi:hypothetical protein ACFQVD_07015 [Streptosporangium amethystogenes subsp. fukuiense]|uniref:Transposase n=1 Tax=Streptosporangium amethystogenes subsp. fukuiense TaxID=698418 RepID=A0ABW2SUY1_9ACTN
MRTHLTGLATRAGLAVEVFKLSRTVQDNALVLQAVHHSARPRPLCV